MAVNLEKMHQAQEKSAAVLLNQAQHKQAGLSDNVD